MVLSGVVCTQQHLGTGVLEFWAQISSTRVGVPLVCFLQTPLGVAVPMQTGGRWRLEALRGVYFILPVLQV